MKKKLLVAILALSLSTSVGLFASAKPSIPWGKLLEMAWDLLKDQFGGTQCAVQVDPDAGGEALKCAPGGGCFWDNGLTITYGGHC